MSCAKRALRKLFGSKQRRLLLLGLDNAGKTTILYRMMGKPASTVPTIGFNVETVKYDPLEFVCWDVSGQDKLRVFWRHYYRGTSGVLFVVDANDQERLPLAKKELLGILKEEELENAAVLILANKTDLPHAVSIDTLASALDVATLKASGRQCHLAAVCALTGVGLDEAIKWLANAVKSVK